jgi:glycosyltransferase involved in cell wall biosynthesis
MEKKKLLSLIVPAYRQEKTIKKDLQNLLEVLSALPLDFELIVVVDGILDGTSRIVRQMKDSRVKLFEYQKNKGKGSAIKYGVEKAQGDVIGFIDAGMDIDPSEISIMLDLMDWNKADVIVASKLHPESQVRYPFGRKILSWGYRTLTHVLFGFSVKDSQVGFKLYRKRVAKDVFPRIIVKRFAFDIEVLTVAQKLGYTRIFEAPVKLNFSGASSITSSNFWKIIFWMLWDTAAVFYRLKILHYYDRK